jgi:hypothetical protein
LRRVTLRQIIGGVFALLGVLVVVIVAWIFYENAFTPAAGAQGSTVNTQPTPAGSLSPTAARALQAYGGEAVWKNASTIETTVTVGGVLFQAKGANVPIHATLTIDVRDPHVVINPLDAEGDIGIVDGFNVSVQSASGSVIEQRSDARNSLQNASLNTKWDRLNLVYFLGYAFWGYNTLPYQLTRTDIQWTELQDGVLQAKYPANVPAHSDIERFWFDKQTGLLRRNDYTPTAAARDTNVANVVFEHGVSNGVPYPSKRRVTITPQQYGWVLPYPDVVTIDVERWQLR